MVRIPVEWLIAGLILFLLLGALLFRVVSRFVSAIILRFRFRKGRKGEILARKFLKKQGFIIVSEQYSVSSLMYIDHVPYRYGIRADFLVRRGDKRAIVEVKTGNRATDPLMPETRRQLFEYYHVFDVDDLYFFDARSVTLQHISFDGL
ncbi:MAG: hypothetical protein JW881_02500 [Spirochaetales bacterium]|nr:hypothetical protein [Spirochaetales bacterium]